MKLKLSIFTLAVILSSCDKDEAIIPITQGDYPVKEYYLERDPKVNVWGAGIDFVHSESELTETDLDYAYLTESDTFSYDIKFYTVKAYSYSENGDLQSEGTPAILLAPTTQACKIGEGISYFDSIRTISEAITGELVYESPIDYSLYKDSETGFYEQENLSAALDACIIGQSFRSNILVVPEGKTEEEVQAVYLIKTIEGAYVKFMVRRFKPDKPNEKQTLVRWQVINK
ncbi:hypothetical protein [Saccharicrinis fermentans]|uniref:HmuY protein n=1 Tax=Saccharicrinis fermentans DSM 9555 = JCM 21142 TaxID=869213 RepID=W7YNL3_9BACT|nr:hypothetical protein [Saccharicrinis fermentans]GAF04019.1 hypothetical protein JCM21142_72712 [Saccharicrinis fermentans DSM 9555 = JCM 21142]